MHLCVLEGITRTEIRIRMYIKRWGHRQQQARIDRQEMGNEHGKGKKRAGSRGVSGRKGKRTTNNS